MQQEEAPLARVPGGVRPSPVSNKVLLEMGQLQEFVGLLRVVITIIGVHEPGGHVSKDGLFPIMYSESRILGCRAPGQGKFPLSMAMPTCKKTSPRGRGEETGSTSWVSASSRNTEVTLSIEC